jgi:hypothetical protein
VIGADLTESSGQLDTSASLKTNLPLCLKNQNRVDYSDTFCRPGSNFRIAHHPARTECESHPRRSIRKMLLAITNPFGASAQG